MGHFLCILGDKITLTVHKPISVGSMPIKDLIPFLENTIKSGLLNEKASH